MTPAEFDDQFNRLTEHFHLPQDANRDRIALEWLQALRHYHVDAVEHGITDLIRNAQETFWPPLGKLTSAIRNRIAGMDRHPGKCQTCHGSGWLDSAPFKSNGMIYENVVVRCPDCGIPAPNYNAPNRREALTHHEYAEWSNGDAERNYMPEAQQAKPLDDAARLAHKAQMLKSFEALRIKLFGKDAA